MISLIVLKRRIKKISREKEKAQKEKRKNAFTLLQACFLGDW